MYISKSDIKEIENILVMPIDFYSYHITKGGIKQYHDSLSNQVKQGLNKAVITMLDKKYTPLLTRVNIHKDMKWMEIENLARRVDFAIRKYIYGSRHIKGAVHLAERDINKDYSIGKTDGSIAAHFVLNSESINTTGNRRGFKSAIEFDAILFIWGWDENSTAHRRGLDVGRAITSSILGTPALPYSDKYFISAMLLNRYGNVVFYNYRHKTTPLILDKDSSKKSIKVIIKALIDETELQ